jgi:hypothetical protein
MIGLSPGAEIINACRLLFPAAAILDAGFLNTIADEDVRTAFRKKALKTHPDRSKALGRTPEELSRMFQELSSAYQTIQTFCSQRLPNAPHINLHQRAGRQSSSMRTGRAAMSDYFYKGVLPRRKLRLGEYLYYSRTISWRALIGAIVWQKRQRPLFGEIARQWKFLSDDDIRLILKKKARDEMFGEYARRHGFLSPFQQMAVTGRQRQLQPLFGLHFVEVGLLSVVQINLMVRRKEQYNRRIRYH